MRIVLVCATALALTACGSGTNDSSETVTQSTELQSPSVSQEVTEVTEVAEVALDETGASVAALQEFESYSLDELYPIMGQDDEGRALAAAKAAYLQVGIAETRKLSNNLWAGIEGLERDRTAAIRLAKVAFESEPEDWSAVRTGLGYRNGTGLPQSAEDAIRVLSNEVVAENPGALYILGLAYSDNGDRDQARAAWTKAADMGHERSAERLR